MKTLATWLLGSAALLGGSNSIVADAYPMILEIPEETERVCNMDDDKYRGGIHACVFEI